MTLIEALIYRLKSKIEETGMTQYELSLKSGVPQSTISAILLGQTKDMKISTLLDLCYALDLELAEFFEPSYFLYKNLDI